MVANLEIGGIVVKPNQFGDWETKCPMWQNIRIVGEFTKTLVFGMMLPVWFLKWDQISCSLVTGIKCAVNRDNNGAGFFGYLSRSAPNRTG